MPLFEVIGTPPDVPPEKKIPMKLIRKMHDTTYRYECSTGIMLLRRITLFDLEEKQIELENIHPEYGRAARASEPLWAIVKGGGTLDAAQMQQLQEAKVILVPYAQEFAVCCFIEPKLESSRDLSDVLFEMVPEERAELLKVLQTLANPSPDGKIQTVALALSRAFGIKIFDEDLSIEKMPAQVAVAMLNVLVDENKKA